MNLLGHKFNKYERALWDSVEYYKCKNCGIIVFEGSDDNYYISYRSDQYNLSNKQVALGKAHRLDISCTDVIIRGIIE